MLVQQQQLRRCQRCHQKGYCLALTARQKPDLCGHTGLKTQIQIGKDLAVALALGAGDAPLQTSAFAATCRKRKVFLNFHFLCRAHHRVLEHATEELGALVLGQMGHIHAVDQHLTAVKAPRAGNGIQQCRFSRTVTADYGNKVAVVEDKVNVLQRHLFVYRAGEEGFTDTF